MTLSLCLCFFFFFGTVYVHIIIQYILNTLLLLGKNLWYLNYLLFNQSFLLLHDNCNTVKLKLNLLFVFIFNFYTKGVNTYCYFYYFNVENTFKYICEMQVGIYLVVG